VKNKSHLLFTGTRLRFSSKNIFTKKYFKFHKEVYRHYLVEVKTFDTV